MSLANDTFLKACRREKVPYTPVWFMRQAGRYLPGYRKLRAERTLLELVRNPELAADITLEPVDTLGVDAAILFADILLILEPMGVAFSFEKGEGPRIHAPLRERRAIENLKVFSAGDELGYVSESIRVINEKLKDRVPLIGFAGGPFTVASYMIEGGHSRHYRVCKGLMYNEPKIWHLLLKKIAENTLSYLTMQIEAGVHAIQLFDSWIGELSPEDYENYVLPHTQFILQHLAAKHPKVPRIHFGTGTATFLDKIKKSGATAVSLDWQTPIPYARKILGEKFAVQGNLDPVALFSTKEILSDKIREILSSAGHEPGHIFNLGHGILPETPVENVRWVVEEVHRLTRESAKQLRSEHPAGKRPWGDQIDSR